MIGSRMLAITFHAAVSARASATAGRSKPQTRSILYESPMPTASPPGTAVESAVEDCVMTSACRNERFGSAAIQGGANVRMLRIVANASSARCAPSIDCSRSSTSR